MSYFVLFFKLQINMIILPRSQLKISNLTPVRVPFYFKTYKRELFSSYSCSFHFLYLFLFFSFLFSRWQLNKGLKLYKT